MYNLFRSFHGVESSFLIFFFILYASITPSLHKNFLGISITQSTPINPLYNYPITLNNQKCGYTNITNCLSDSNDTTDCCILSKDSNIFPSDTVPDSVLLVIVFLVPSVVIVLRSITWKFLLINNYSNNHFNSEPFSISQWVLITWDVLFGLLFALLLQLITTTYFKLAVGAPRPNYYSLTAWAEVKSGRSYYKTGAYQSFPSGHSSTSAAGFGYLALLMLSDFRITSQASPLVFVTISCLSISIASLFIALYVASTRVIDYWHFQWDVIAGLLIGYLSAAVAIVLIRTFEGFRILNRLQVSLAQKYLSSQSEKDYSYFLDSQREFRSSKKSDYEESDHAKIHLIA